MPGPPHSCVGMLTMQTLSLFLLTDGRLMWVRMEEEEVKVTQFESATFLPAVLFSRPGWKIAASVGMIVELISNWHGR